MNGTSHIEKSTSLWSLTFALLVVISLFTSMNGNGINNGVVVLIESQGGAASLSGVITAGFSFAALVFRFVSGNLSDVFGRKKIILWGCLFLGAGCLLALCVNNLSVLIATRILMGVGFAMVSTTAAAATADLVPKERLGEGLGYQGMSVAIAMALGPSLSIWLVQWRGSAALFGAFLLLAVLSLALTNVCTFQEVVKPPAPTPAKELFGEEALMVLPDEDERAKPMELKNYVELIFEKSALPATAVMLLSCLSLGIYLMYVSLFAVKYSIEGTFFYFLIAAGVMLLIRLFCGKLVDAVGANRILVPSFAAGAVGLLVLMLFRSTAALYVSGALYGVFCGFQQPVLLAEALRRTPSHRRGAASGLLFAACDVGIGLGSLLWGAVIDILGFSAAFVGGAAFLVVSACVSLMLLRRRPE